MCYIISMYILVSIYHAVIAFMLFCYSGKIDFSVEEDAHVIADCVKVTPLMSRL